MSTQRTKARVMWIITDESGDVRIATKKPIFDPEDMSDGIRVEEGAWIPLDPASLAAMEKRASDAMKLNADRNPLVRITEIDWLDQARAALAAAHPALKGK